MKFDLNLRLKIFLICVLVILGGQIFYSYKNYIFFKKSYVSALKAKCENLGQYVKSDIEYVLDFGIPITRLVKLENTMKDVLDGVRELEFIEITDLDRNLLYYADHKELKRIQKGEKESLFFNQKETEKIRSVNLLPEMTDINFTLYYNKKNKPAGYLNMRLSPEIIGLQTRQILFDMITVIMTSFLITFEFLTFFSGYSIRQPIEKMIENINRSSYELSPLKTENYNIFKEFQAVIEKINFYVFYYFKAFFPILRFKKVSSHFKDLIISETGKQKQIISKLGSGKNILKISENCSEIEDRCKNFDEKLQNSFFQKKYESDETLVKKEYNFIRPVVFLFIMADGFSISFFPLFVEQLYEPFAGISREVMIGIPMSVYMLFVAVSMPLSGKFADHRGWYKVLISGLLINSAGLFMTAFSYSIISLIFFRIITAVGFGIVFISCQKFIIDNTSAKSRSFGMASFLAAFFSGDICGTVIGGMLAQRIGYADVFLISAFFSLSAAAGAVLIFKNKDKTGESEKTDHKRLPFTFKELFTVFKDRKFTGVLLFQAIPAKITLIGFLFYFTPLYLNKIGVLQSDIGRIIMSYSIAVIFAGPLFSGFMQTQKSRKYFIAGGGIITGISLVLFYFFNGFTQIFIVVTMLGIAQSFSVPSQASFISETEVVKKMGVGTGMGVFRFWEKAGNVLGPVVAGFFISGFGYVEAVVYIGAISIASSFLYLLIIITDKKADA
jgi:predicted MFS family arabinose efflux permease